MAHRALVRQVSANVTLATRSMASSSSTNKRPRDDNGTAAVADLKKPKGLSPALDLSHPTLTGPIVTHPFFSSSKAGLDSSAPSPWQRCPSVSHPGRVRASCPRWCSNPPVNRHSP